jgi:hypothetical protein
LPQKDIKQDYSADVRYGMLAGLNPAQGLIFMLQALGGGLISKDMAMRELPFNVNVTQEQEKIEVEKMRDSLLNSLQAMTQVIPQMVMQGQDPSDLVRKLSEVIQKRQTGTSIEDAIEEVFEPKNPPAGAEEQLEQPVPAAPAEPSAGGASPQEMPMPQERPDLQTMLATMTGSGDVRGGASVKRERQI